MSKKIIINKHLMESAEFKEVVLSSCLSKQIKDELNRGETPLSNNPSFPEEDGTAFDLRLTLLRYKETKDELLNIGVMEEDEDIHNLLPSLIETCKRIEEPFRRNLEKIAYNFIIETFNVPEGVINLIVKLHDDLSNTTLNVRVQSEDVDYEFNDISHKHILHSEIYKRRIMNALMSGAALRIATNIKKYMSDIYDINPKLLTLYRNTLALNEYMLFNVDKIEINDKNKNQLGLSNVTIGNELTKSEVIAEGVIFPILIYELVKAFLELSAAHGLPKSKEEATYVMGKADFLQAEPWYMRIGPALYDILISLINGFDEKMLPYIFMELSQIEPDAFANVMQEIFSKTKNGRKILNDIVDVYKSNFKQDEIQPTMATANTKISIINDEIIHENIVSNNSQLITEISCKDAYSRFYSNIPENIYKKIVSAVQDDFNILTPDAKWVLKLYQNKSPRVLEDLYKLRNEYKEGYLQIFNRLKTTRRITGDEADLFKYKSISELGRFTSTWDIEDVWMDGDEWKKTHMRSDIINAKDDITKHYEDDTWLVISPKSYEASCYWGDGTEWCTAYKDSDKYYKLYSSEGPLYININKKTGEKYQFHFESLQFMDSDDDDINKPILYTIRANDGLYKFYKEIASNCNQPEAYLALMAQYSEYGFSFDIYCINNEYYFYDLEDETFEELGSLDYYGDWECIDSSIYRGNNRDYLALVRSGNKVNYINGYGELIYQWVEDMSSPDLESGYIIIKNNGKLGIINHYGKKIIDCGCDIIEPIYNSYDNILYYKIFAEGEWAIFHLDGRFEDFNEDEEYVE